MPLNTLTAMFEPSLHPFAAGVRKIDAASSVKTVNIRIEIFMTIFISFPLNQNLVNWALSSIANRNPLLVHCSHRSLASRIHDALGLQ